MAERSTTKRKRPVTVAAKLKKRRVSQLARGQAERARILRELDEENVADDLNELLARLRRLERESAAASRESANYRTLLHRFSAYAGHRDALLRAISARTKHSKGLDETHAAAAQLTDVIDVLASDLEAWRVAQVNQLEHVQMLNERVQRALFALSRSSAANADVHVPRLGEDAAAAGALVPSGGGGAHTADTAPSEVRKAQKATALRSGTVMRAADARTAVVHIADAERASRILPSSSRSILLANVAGTYVHASDTSTARLYERHEAGALQRAEQRRQRFEATLERGGGTARK